MRRDEGRNSPPRQSKILVIKKRFQSCFKKYNKKVTSQNSQPDSWMYEEEEKVDHLTMPAQQESINVEVTSPLHFASAMEPKDIEPDVAKNLNINFADDEERTGEKEDN